MVVWYETNSWNKRLIISLPHSIYLRPLSFMKDGQLLFRNSYCGFVAYNSTTQNLKQVNVARIKEGLYFDKVVTMWKICPLLIPKGFTFSVSFIDIKLCSPIMIVEMVRVREEKMHRCSSEEVQKLGYSG